MTDHDLAQSVLCAVDALNFEISVAHDAGLRVEVSIVETHEIEDRYPRPILAVVVSRVVG